MRALWLIVLLGGCQTTSAIAPVGEGPGDDMSPQADLRPVGDLGSTAMTDLAPSADLAPARVGSVLLDSDATGGTTQSYVYPVFADVTPDTGCTRTVANGCTVEICTSSNSAPPSPRFYGAGAIHVTGGLYDVTASPASDGSYAESGDGTRALWRGGDLLTITGTGDVVPPFGLTLQAPAQILVTAPTSSNSIAIDRTRDFVVTWNATMNNIEISLGADGDGTSYGSIDCILPAATGSYAIAASLLSQMPAGSGTLIVESVSQRTLVASNWTIYTFARSLAADGNGGGFRKAATVE